MQVSYSQELGLFITDALYVTHMQIKEYAYNQFVL